MVSYQVNEDQRLQYAGLFLLEQLLRDEVDFFVRGDDGQEVLAPVFSWLQKQGYVATDKDTRFILTSSGSDILHQFQRRYRKFLRESDVFCAVDLGAGEFAFSYFDDFDSQESWKEFLEQDRWEDLRVAVAEHEGEDIIELIFMDMVNEHYFGIDDNGAWSRDKLLGSIWNEIEEIASGAIHIRNLSYISEGTLVSGDDVIRDILVHGRNLIGQFHHQDKQSEVSGEL